VEGAKALQFLDDISRTIGRPYAYKQVHVVGLNSQFKDIPSFLSTLLLDQLCETILERACKNGLASFGTPDEMIDNEMYPVLISLVVHFVGVCRYHGSDPTPFSTELQEARAKANEKPASPLGLKPQRLAAGSLSSCFKATPAPVEG
jgi:hypothetical protein